MTELIKIGNDGPVITSTNYWESNYNQQGVLFFSLNAGAFRLLLPGGNVVGEKEILTAKQIVIFLGPGFGRHQIFEIMFDDNSDNPYCLLFGTELADRLPDAKDNKKRFRFIVYKKGLQVVMDTTCYFRMVSKIPCLKPKE